MVYIKNFFLNIISLFVALTKERIDWKSSICSIQECDIDKHAKLYAPYYLKRVKIGYGTYISSNSKISKATIGKFCSIGPNFRCGYGIHPTNGISTSPVFYSTKMQTGFTFSKADKMQERKPITIGNDVFIGMNVTILDGVTICNGAVIGAGAVVSKDIPPYAIAVGCPIKVIKYRFEPEVIKQLLELQWWDKDENTLRKVEEHFFDVSAFLEDANKHKEVNIGTNII